MCEGSVLLFMNKVEKYYAITIMAATIATTSIICTNCKSNAYEVLVNNKPVLYCENKDYFLKEYINFKKNKKLNLNNEVSYRKVRVHEENVSSKEDVKKIIWESDAIEIPAYVMKSDGKKLCIVESRKEGEKVLNDIKNYYIESGNIKNIKENTLKNKITYENSMESVNNIEGEAEIAGKILNENERSNYKDIEYKFICENTEDTVVPFGEEIKWSSDLYLGQQKVETKGADGLIKSTIKKTYKNDKLEESKLVKKETARDVINKVIVRGSKAASQSVLASPSRGRYTSYFGLRWGRMHEGIDIAANMGDNIKAAKDGIVCAADYEDGYGNVVKINHEGGLVTIYGHCSKLLVSVGQKIIKGQIIALVGSTGNSTGPHIHFEVRKNGVAVNPLEYLK